MPAAETARLIASLELQDKNFTRGLRNVESGIGRVDKKLSAFGGFVNRNLARGVDMFAAKLVTGVFEGVDSLVELEQQQAQTNAVLKSTGQIAGITGEQVTALSEKYEGLNAIIGDEVVRSAENMLLTFTNVNKEAFEPALAAILDMNTAMGKGPEGLTTTAIQVGKALNDPTKGMTALRKVGVAFTADQVKKIKSLQKEGKLYEAQQIILKELNKEFGGSFAAQGDTTAGKVAKFHDAVEDLQRTFAKALLPIIVKVADKLGKFLSDPKVVKGIEQAGEALGKAFDDILAAAEKVPWSTIGNGLRMAAGFAGELVRWFQQIPDWAQALIIGGFAATKLPVVGGLVSELGKGLIKGVLGINAGVVNVNGPVSGMGGAGGAAGGGKSLLGRLGSGIKILGAVTIAGASIVALAEAWGEFQTTVTESQESLTEKVEQTRKQDFRQTLDNLTATNKNLERMNGFEEIIASGFGGGQITKDFEMAADRIRNKFEAGQLTREDMTAAIAALAGSSQQGKELNLDIPKTNELLADLITAVNRGATPSGRGQADPKDHSPARLVTDPKIPRALSAQTTELGNIKNAMATLNTKSEGQKAELANIKNATVTLDANQKAQSVAQIATTVAGNVAQAAAAVRQSLAAAAQTAATRTGLLNTTSAARQAGLTASAAMSQAATRIVGAVNALDLSVNVTTVNRTSTINNRYGPSGGSSTTQRAGGNTG